MAVRGVHRTVRFRITAVAVLAVGVILVTASIALLVVQRSELNRGLDESLERRFEILVAQINDSGVPDGLPADDEDRFTEVLVDGVIVASTPRSDEGPFRTFQGVVDSPQGSAEIVLGETTEDVDDSVRVLRNSLLVMVPLALFLVGGVVWWLVGRTLKPVEDIREEVERIGAGELDRRVPEPDTGDEIAALGATMNQMLQRVDDAVRRQQRFAADASHELRSPLTRIRTQLEVDAARPETADLTATSASVLEETIAMQDMVDDLLYLARVDSGTDTGRHQPVDLDDLVREEGARIEAETGVTVDLSRLSGASVSGDRTGLRRAIRNVLANAARFADTQVGVQLSESGKWAVLVIDDDGPGIPVAQRQRVFERFTRLDEARSTESGGTGLGLAIVKEILEGHGGSVEVDDAPSGGARVVLRLPAAQP